MNRPFEYWRDRWRAAGLRLDHSFGAFAEDGRLVGFLLHAIGRREYDQMAFNVGTGVLPAYRGQRLVGKLYEVATPQLRQAGCTHVGLEVIKANERALRAYHHVGFRPIRELDSFAGAVLMHPSYHGRTLELEELLPPQWKQFFQPLHPPAWDHRLEALQRFADRYAAFRVHAGPEIIGAFLIERESGYLPHFTSLPTADWERGAAVLGATQKVHPELRILNVDVRDQARVRAVKHAGLVRIIDQYEMMYPISLGTAR